MTLVESRLHHTKRFGQHFLTGAEIADRIAGYAGLTPVDYVLEIGPGRGMLTERLLARTPHVTAVEVDRDLIGELRSRFEGRGNFRLVEGDILRINLEEVFRDVPVRIKVVSNIPFNISSSIIDLLIRSRSVVALAVLMVQKEVALRLIAPAGSREYGLTTVNLRLCATIERVMDVKPGAFAPPPEVMSSVVRIEFFPGYRYPLSDERIFREVTGAAFRHRRKMLRNTLAPYLETRGIAPNHVVAFLEQVGVNPVSRPENIDVTDWARLARAIGELG